MEPPPPLPLFSPTPVPHITAQKLGNLSSERQMANCKIYFGTYMMPYINLIINRCLSFNVLKQNRISLPRTSILFYRQPCFWPQTQICLSRFPVTGSKYAYSMLIYKLIKFCCVPQQSFPIMYKSNLLFLLTSMMQWAVDESNRKRIVWEKWSV